MMVSLWQLFGPGLEHALHVGAVELLATRARSPSGKAKVCKTFIGGSIPPRASISSPRQTSCRFEISCSNLFVLNVSRLPSAVAQPILAMRPPRRFQIPHKSVPVLQNSGSLHFVGTASKLLVLLTRK